MSTTKPCPKCGGLEFHSGIATDENNTEYDAVCCENPDCDFACKRKDFIKWQKEPGEKND